MFSEMDIQISLGFCLTALISAFLNAKNSELNIIQNTVVRKENCCHHFQCYSFQLAARDLLYATSYRNDSRYCSVCFLCVVEHWLE